MMPPVTVPTRSNAVHKPIVASLSALLALSEPETEVIRLVLHNFPQNIEAMECRASAADLKRFIRWALQQSYSPALTTDEKLQLLDIAWKVQQLLWSC